MTMLQHLLGRLHLDNGWSHRHVIIFRVLLGSYLVVHFAQLLPFASEMFSSVGVLPAHASPLLHAFPNVLLINDAPAVVTSLVVVAGLASACLLLGVQDRVAAVVIWYVWACLFGRNPLISNPGLPYVGLLLIVHALRPTTTSATTANAIAPPLYAVMWILMAVGYSYSGLTKLPSISWQDGSAFRFVLESPLARPGAVRDALLTLPHVVIVTLSTSALVLELLYAPLALSRRLRPIIWTAMVLMHAGLVVVVDFADLSLGMLLLHAYTFDPAWLRNRSA